MGRKVNLITDLFSALSVEKIAPVGGVKVSNHKVPEVPVLVKDYRCPHCLEVQKATELAFIDVGTKWTRVQCGNQRCRRIFGIPNIDVRSVKEFLKEELGEPI